MWIKILPVARNIALSDPRLSPKHNYQNIPPPEKTLVKSGAIAYYVCDEVSGMQCHSVQKLGYVAVIIIAVSVMWTAMRWNSTDVLWHPAPRAWIGKVGLPKYASNGLPISSARRIALLPSCLSCALKSMDKDWQFQARRCDVIIVFDTKEHAKVGYSEIFTWNKPIMFEPLSESIPEVMSMIAPGIAELDKSGKVVSTDVL